MPGAYLWGITTVRPSRQEARLRQRAAESEGAEYVEANVRPGSAPGINGGRYQGWYSGPNLGSPFDRDMAQKIAATLSTLRAALEEA